MVKFKILPELPTKRRVPPSSGDSSTGTEEDEVEMANCLILLARGGNRARNKKPKLTSPAAAAAEEGLKRVGNKLSSKIHECSVCGSVFGSGQALGGHMRRHRVIGGKPRRAAALDLDLNMPAPAEVEEKCNQRPRMAFSAAALLVIGG